MQAIPLDDAKEKWVTDGVCLFVEKLIEGKGGLDERFPVESETLLSAFDIFNFDNFPATEEDWARIGPTYGDAEIGTLIAHYGSPKKASLNDKQYERVVNPTTLRHEWPLLRKQLFGASLRVRAEICKQKLSSNDPKRQVIIDEAYAELLRSDSLPETKRLLSIFCILCLSTVWCERGFSLMAITKQKLRNRLTVITLDALMMVAANGPSMTETEAIDTLINEALVYWKSKCKRNVNKSHPGVGGRGNKKTSNAVPLSELQEAQARADRRAAAARDGPALSDDSDDDLGDDNDNDNDNDNDSGTSSATGDAAAGADGGAATGDGANSITTAQIREAVGAYCPEPDWEVLPPPAETQEDWNTRCSWKKRTWAGVKLAHIFDDEWSTGTYKNKYTGVRDYGDGPHWTFHYSKFKEDYVHSLLLKEYGLTQSWVMLKKKKNN